MNTILVIEDDQRLATLLHNGILEAGHQVLLAYDAEMALRLVRQNGDIISLVISDIILPGISGIQLCRQLRQTHPSIPILLLTALGTTDDKLEGFDAGADDYLTKPFDFRELLARISVLLRRGPVRQPQEAADPSLSLAGLQLIPHKHQCTRNGTPIHLTPKEFSLLQYLMENASRVVSRSEIQENVWHTHFDTGTNFIDVYINYLRRKIDKDYEPRLIHTKPGIGFILSQDEE